MIFIVVPIVNNKFLISISLPGLSHKNCLALKCLLGSYLFPFHSLRFCLWVFVIATKICKSVEEACELGWVKKTPKNHSLPGLYPNWRKQFSVHEDKSIPAWLETGWMSVPRQLILIHFGWVPENRTKSTLNLSADLPTFHLLWRGLRWRIIVFYSYYPSMHLGQILLAITPRCFSLPMMPAKTRMVKYFAGAKCKTGSCFLRFYYINYCISSSFCINSVFLGLLLNTP